MGQIGGCRLGDVVPGKHLEAPGENAQFGDDAGLFLLKGIGELV